MSPGGRGQGPESCHARLRTPQESSASVGASVFPRHARIRSFKWSARNPRGGRPSSFMAGLNGVNGSSWVTRKLKSDKRELTLFLLLFSTRYASQDRKWPQDTGVGGACLSPEGLRDYGVGCLHSLPSAASRSGDLFLETILHLFLEGRRNRHGTPCKSGARDTLIPHTHTVRCVCLGGIRYRP